MLLLLLPMRYHIMNKILTLIPLYSSITIKLVEVNYIELKLQGIIIMECGVGTEMYFV
jgi:hypothetical protein